MKNILITGTNGFIGKNLYNELKNKFQYNLYCLDQEYFDNINWKEYLINYLNNIKPEVIFHVGACSNTLETNVQYIMTRNFESTKVFVDWCKSNKAILIFSSSAANYGINYSFPSNLYGWSKYVAEQYVISNGFIALRYFNVYGPGEEHKGKMASFIYQCLIKNKTKEAILLFPNNPKRDFIHVNDVIKANLHAYENFHNLNKTYYDVGLGKAHSFEYILNTLYYNFSYYDEKDIPNGYQFYTCSDHNKWLNGWSPEISLEEGLKNYKNII